MPVLTLQAFAPSVRINRGRIGCVRQLMVSIIKVPGIVDTFLYTAFMATDRNALDAARPMGFIGDPFFGLSYGVSIDSLIFGGTFTTFDDRAIIETERDVFLRAVLWDMTINKPLFANNITVAVESF